MENNTGKVFLTSMRDRFKAIKSQGERTVHQLSDADLLWQPNYETNSIAIIIQHLNGSTISRWTDLLTTDGEKESRKRDDEFVQPDSINRDELMVLWDEGWQC